MPNTSHHIKQTNKRLCSLDMGAETLGHFDRLCLSQKAKTPHRISYKIGEHVPIFPILPSYSFSTPLVFYSHLSWYVGEEVTGDQQKELSPY